MTRCQANLNEQVGQHEAPLVAADAKDEKQGCEAVDAGSDGFSQDDGPEVELDVRDDGVDLTLLELVFLKHLLEDVEEVLQVLFDRIEAVPVAEVRHERNELGHGEDEPQEPENEGPGSDVDAAAAPGHLEVDQTKQVGQRAANRSFWKLAQERPKTLTTMGFKLTPVA